jgi:hypothetical protein
MAEPMSEGVKILYKGAIDNIIFLKRQQWIITNYSLVVYAIMAALARNATSVEKTILVVVALCAFAYSAACMLHTQSTMRRLRASMSHIYQTYFSVEERETYKLWQAPPGFLVYPAFYRRVDSSKHYGARGDPLRHCTNAILVGSQCYLVRKSHRPRRSCRCAINDGGSKAATPRSGKKNA